MPKVIIQRAVPGRIVKGKFVREKPNPKGRRRNIAAGFYDKQGIFHPIRPASDYDAGRAGEGRKRAAKKKKVKAKRAAPKKRAPKKKAAPKRKAAKKRSRR